ncbi:MAG: hypothetical protein HY320_13435 [Armatimonadetes bacterium]|nr:hypothetical protein [Armatimonadota bacterium]
MREPTAFYPWTLNWMAVAVMLIGGAVTIVALYLAARSGRETPSAPNGNEPPIRDYAGVAQEGSNTATVFVIVFILFTLLWAAAYVLHAALYGLSY